MSKCCGTCKFFITSDNPVKSWSMGECLEIKSALNIEIVGDAYVESIDIDEPLEFYCQKYEAISHTQVSNTEEK